MHKANSSALLAGSIFLLAVLFPATAENRISVDIDSGVIGSGSGSMEDSWSGGGYLKGAVSFDQSGERNLKSGLRIEAASSSLSGDIDSFNYTLSRAFVKFRFPALNASVGKSPLRWGEGRFFNAGNLPFPADTSGEDNLYRREFEDPALWNASLRFPLGLFSFLELTAVPPEQEILLEHSAVGLRYVAKPLGIKSELAYILDGRDSETGWKHRVAVGLQGNLLIDWHLTTAVAVPGEGSDTTKVKESLRISGGLYTLLPGAGSGRWQLRLEGLLSPFGQWSSDGALFLYPELSRDNGNGLSLFLRSVINPLDASAKIIPGTAWNVYQGFNLMALLSIQAGEKGDSFSFTAVDGLVFQLGCSVRY